MAELKEVLAVFTERIKTIKNSNQNAPNCNSDNEREFEMTTPCPKYTKKSQIIHNCIFSNPDICICPAC